VNKIILLGNLTRDPEVRYSQSAEPLAIAKYSLAVNRRFKREGEQDVDFIACVSFGKQAELIEKYFRKGSKMLLTGRLQVRSYDDQSGQRRWITEVVGEELEFVESKSAFEARMAGGGGANYGGQSYEPPDGGHGGGFGPDRAAPPRQPAFEPEGFSAITQSIDEDDLPF